MKYKIVDAHDGIGNGDMTGRLLARKVKDCIEEGWEPIGGISACSHHDCQRLELFQAMIKNDFTKQPPAIPEPPVSEIIKESKDKPEGR